MRISDWSADVCSSDLHLALGTQRACRRRLLRLGILAALGKTFRDGGRECRARRPALPKITGLERLGQRLEAQPGVSDQAQRLVVAETRRAPGRDSVVQCG